jgi:hypothetical protein
MIEKGEQESKWPWSVTEREFGALEQELKEVRHDLRNLKMIVVNSGIATVSPEDVNDVRTSLTKLHNTKATKDNIDNLSIEFNQFKTKVYTAFSVVVVLVGVVGWLIDTVLKIMGR